VTKKIRFLAVLAIGLCLANTSGGSLAAKSALPPRYEVATPREARLLAGPQCIAVLGTGSMRPYIPASPDPRQIVAYASTEKTPYAELQKGELVVYRWQGGFIVHQIVARQGDSWISSGLSNRRYDALHVTRETYDCRVVRVYVIKPSGLDRRLAEK
jgi:hypothetical protein